ncbi:FAD-linked oxidase C-terminal domain-containing protein [Cupriavidus basilensis]
MERNGSISAEHGVGTAKRDELLHVRSEVELKLAWRVKRALDPDQPDEPGQGASPHAHELGVPSRNGSAPSLTTFLVLHRP